MNASRIGPGDVVAVIGQFGYGDVLAGPLDTDKGPRFSVSMWDGRALSVPPIHLIRVDPAHTSIEGEQK